MTPRRVLIHLVPGHDLVLEALEEPAQSIVRRLALVLENILNRHFVRRHVPLELKPCVFALMELLLRLLVE